MSRPTMRRAGRTRRPALAAALTLAALSVLAALGGCGETRQAEPASEVAAATSVAESKLSELGPVRATVSIGPEEPRIGDPLTLTLEVTAEPGVDVEMPAFGEALGRFQIARFVPREQIAADGGLVATQVYTLQAPMSGRLRVPPLRIEFLDERANSAPAADTAAGDDEAVNAAAGAAAGASAGGMSEIQELLTEELAIEVASVAPEGAATDALAGLAEPLVPPSRARVYLLLALLALAVCGLGGYLAVRTWRRAARRQVRISAYDKAMAKLRVLEQRGLPQQGDDDAEIDAWYVELSSIVRRYLEDRYGLRAPELTTEEFLREAQRSGLLSSTHRARLSDFLSRCDRVKFARYKPGEEETREVLASARSFLDDTRLSTEPVQPAVQQGA
ncbi:hypothetical protein [Haliangium ochraceum]|uniref:MxaA protein n=1 Tax=Haliangium ochraceum (strain DSM 14365 / JCM 11303 / SMP-2) TaxID=502025 RepID=D0LKC6_HALO1|nr:hypothetical protein [Haliangium ochraceum]ACY13160.1 hypothetical protein Hoch_0521 [Haliangium ochraceum DSM 14365]